MEWGGGQWSNDNILQLLELYKEEPCLWDPRTPNYKNRCAHASAWERILNKLPFKTTVDEAKKKKNSLMGYYRIHLNRYKRSFIGGRSVYHTTWFAFELMHSFLSPVYGPKKKKVRMSPGSTTGDGEMLIEVKSEPRSDSESGNQEEIYIDDYKEEFPLEISEESPLKDALFPEVNVNEVNESESIKRLNSSEINDGSPVNKQTIEKVEIQPGRETTKRTNAACDCLNRERDFVRRDKQEALDEYDHFGFMLASKIRKINCSPEREILMNSIQNLVFESYMRSRKNKNQET